MTDAPRSHSYDPGEQLRVTGGAAGALHILHGAHEIAKLTKLLEGRGVRIQADGREWRLRQDDSGWSASGDPPATLRKRALRASVLTIAGEEWSVRGRAVSGLLRFTKDTDGGKPSLKGEIVQAPPAGSDAHAVIALATAAIALGTDLSRPLGAHDGINGSNTSAAVRYGYGA